MYKFRRCRCCRTIGPPDQAVETGAARRATLATAAGTAAAARGAATVEGSEVAGLVGATRVGAAEATAVACILHRSRRSRSLRHMRRRGPSGLRRRRGCHGHIDTYWRTSTRSHPSTVMVGYEGVGTLPASALLSLPLGLLASVVLRY